MCNIEFPHFGASYPDAHCINGYLWDMDSYENGCYTIGGGDPCPFCNTEAWLKIVLDNEEFASREEALEWVEKMREKWGAEHGGSSEIPKDLDVAAIQAAQSDMQDRQIMEASNDERMLYSRIFRRGFKAGAKWQKEQYHFFNKAWTENMQAELDRNYENGKQAMKEQMLREAVEGRVISNDGISFPVSNEIHRLKLMEGDKVRVIVIPNTDEK